MNNNILYFNGTNIVDNTKVELKAYHYTSPEGLYSIIQNEKLWFTDCQFMNDRSEFVYIKKILSKTLKLLNWENPESFANYMLTTPYETIDYKRGIKNFTKGIEKFRYYLFCTSLNADSYNMWSYFTKNGQCLGYNMCFDIDSFIKLFEAIPDVTLIHGNVIYNEERQINEIKAEVDKLQEQYDEKVKNTGDTCYDEFGNEYNPEDLIIEEFQNELLEFLLNRCLFYKSPAFASENEYRFVLKVKSSYSGDLKLNHRVGNNGVIIPYMELDLKSLQEMKKFMKQITLAPMLEKEVAMEGLISFLGLKYKREFDIKYSDIDVRF